MVSLKPIVSSLKNVFYTLLLSFCHCKFEARDPKLGMKTLPKVTYAPILFGASILIV